MSNKKRLLLCAVLSIFSTHSFAGADLIIEDISFLSLPAKGGCTNFSVTIANIGDERAEGSGLFSLRANSLTTSQLGAERQFGIGRGVDPGESMMVSVISLEFPAVGEHRIVAVVDSRNEVEEYVEGSYAEQNNGFKKDVNVRHTCTEDGRPQGPTVDPKFIKNLHIDPKEGRPNLNPKVRLPIPRSVTQ